MLPNSCNAIFKTRISRISIVIKVNFCNINNLLGQQRTLDYSVKSLYNYDMTPHLKKYNHLKQNVIIIDILIRYTLIFQTANFQNVSV